MSWDQRQRAMLAEMGLRVWDSPSAAVAASPEPVVATVVLKPPVKLEPVLQELQSGPLDWAGLQQSVASCQACPLGATRKNPVFGVGSPGAHWLVVGEAPDEQEDLQGLPFVGQPGQLLDNMLHALGVSRSGETAAKQAFVTSILKCRSQRNPQAAELAQCEPYLVRQIEVVQPRIILAMGRFAVQSLLRSNEPIGRLRGQVHQYQGLPLIVTYHPVYLLKHPSEKAGAWEDLCLALQTLQSAQ